MSKRRMIATGTTRRTPTGVVLKVLTATDDRVVDVAEWLMAQRRERPIRRRWTGPTGGTAA